MGNYLKPNVADKLRGAFQSGMSLRKAAAFAGVAKATAARYRGPLAQCKCGELQSHRGWCWWRYAASPARQAFMRRLTGTLAQPTHGAHRCRSAAFVPSEPTDPFFLSLLRDIPPTIPRDVRDEVIQDAALLVMEGTISLTEVHEHVSLLVKEVFRRYPTRFGPKSLNQSHGGDDTRTLGERLGVC
jgi:hypothetical protein